MQISPTLHRMAESTSHENFYRGVVFIMGLALGFGVGNGHTTQDAIKSVSVQLGTQKQQTTLLKKKLGCEQYRANLISALVTSNTDFDPKDLPVCDTKGNPR